MCISVVDFENILFRFIYFLKILQLPAHVYLLCLRNPDLVPLYLCIRVSCTQVPKVLELLPDLDRYFGILAFPKGLESLEFLVIADNKGKAEIVILKEIVISLIEINTTGCGLDQIGLFRCSTR